MTLARPATARDAAVIARIYNEGIADRVATFETEPRTPDDIARLLEHREAHWPTVVVERDGTVVAWAGASEYRPRACYAGVADFSVYVDRAHRGAGAGRMAMEALVAACEMRGIHSSCRACSRRTRRVAGSSPAWASGRSARTGGTRSSTANGVTR